MKCEISVTVNLPDNEEDTFTVNDVSAQQAMNVAIDDNPSWTSIVMVIVRQS